MMDLKLKVTKVSDEKLAYKNCVFLHKSIIGTYRTLSMNVDGKKFYFNCQSSFVKETDIAMTLAQRKWTNASLDQVYSINLCHPLKNIYITKIIVEIDFLYKNKITDSLIDSEKLVGAFLNQFAEYPLSLGQIIFFNFDNSLPPFEITVTEIEVSDGKNILDNMQGTKADLGVLALFSQILFKKTQVSRMNLIGKAKETAMSSSLIISPNFDFNTMGIGGLDKEFSVIFRRAFSSRLFAPEIVSQFGGKHVRGILLFGPPGTGKTLMARQIGKMLNAREPKIVHGPDILNKYVGESEANIRKLFADAEAEQLKSGDHSQLHIIIFDEIDAICKKRGSTTGGTGVNDSVVNQLLSKIDGVNQLNNVLLIGMTNRKDLIDDALMRPGRFEIQLEISLPDEKGRLQILSIHTSNLSKNKKLDKSVNLEEIAAETKNFSGAEIEGLVRAATSVAMNRIVKLDGTVKIDTKKMDDLVVTMNDFKYALQNDVKPMFGAAIDDLTVNVNNQIVNWCENIEKLISDVHLLIDQTKNGGIISPVSVLLYGEAGSGKTAFASQMALDSDFPLIKQCSADQMVGFTELSKCLSIKEIFDAACKSELSCIVIDNIERILEYVPIGPRFSNTILQALLVLLNKRLPKKHKLLIIATTNSISVMEDMGISQIFTRTLKIPVVTKLSELEIIIKFYEFFSDDVCEEIFKQIKKFSIYVSIKKLLGICEMAKQDMNPALKFIELSIDEKIFTST